MPGAPIGRPDPLRILRALRRLPRASRDEIEAYQSGALRRLLGHAHARVPYYRRLFDESGVRPESIGGVADLGQVPITGKRDLRALPAREVIAAGLDAVKLVTYRTSGSSGEPFTIRRTWLEHKLLELNRIRAHAYFGTRLGDRVARVVVLRRPIASGGNPLRKRIGPYRVIDIDIFQDVATIAARLAASRPAVVASSPGALARIAAEIVRPDGGHHWPRFLLSGSEVLSPLLRRRITEGFGAPVFDWYGAFEFGLLAWECKEGCGLHVCDDSLVLEILRDGHPVAPGERGEVVATGLHSYAMPFIRYRLGDLATRGPTPCACGHPSSTIVSLEGRMLDFFLLPDGRALHPSQMVVVLLGHDWIRQYQLLQAREDHVVLHLVPAGEPSPEQLGALHQALSALLGRGVRLEILLGTEIPIETTGKFRVSRSLVNSVYDGIDLTS